jgi:hypothetical protein
MTLASVIQNVANEAGYTVDSVVVGSSETTTKQLYAMTNRVSREMSDAFPWPKFFAAGSITLVAGQASYALPAAFSFQQYDSFWNQSTRWRVLGPMSEQEYAEIQGFGLNPTIYQRYQIRGISSNQLLISPTPTESGDIIIFEYIAARSVRPKEWATGVVYAANTYTFYDGNYYFTVSGGTTGGTAPTHTSGSVSDGGVTWAYYNGAYEDFLADTDVTVLNEKTLEQGVLERFAELHGIPVAPRYETQLNEDFTRANPGKILVAGLNRDNLLFARTGRAVFGTWI